MEKDVVGRRIWASISQGHRPTGPIHRAGLPQDISTNNRTHLAKRPQMMMWIVIQWAQVTAGVGFPLLEALERFLPHAVDKRFLSISDFLADSEFTLEIVNTYTVCLRRVHDRILVGNVLAGSLLVIRTVRYKLYPIPVIPSSRMPLRYLHC
jgi:hypothetical protein